MRERDGGRKEEEEIKGINTSLLSLRTLVSNWLSLS